MHQLGNEQLLSLLIFWFPLIPNRPKLHINICVSNTQELTILTNENLKSVNSINEWKFKGQTSELKWNSNYRDLTNLWFSRDRIDYFSSITNCFLNPNNGSLSHHLLPQSGYFVYIVLSEHTHKVCKCFHTPVHTEPMRGPLFCSFFLE